MEYIQLPKWHKKLIWGSCVLWKVLYCKLNILDFLKWNILHFQGTFEFLHFQFGYFSDWVSVLKVFTPANEEFIEKPQISFIRKILASLHHKYTWIMITWSSSVYFLIACVWMTLLLLKFGVDLIRFMEKMLIF